MHLEEANQKSVPPPLKPVIPPKLNKHWTLVKDDEIRRIRKKYPTITLNFCNLETLLAPKRIVVVKVLLVERFQDDVRSVVQHDLKFESCVKQ